MGTPFFQSGAVVLTSDFDFAFPQDKIAMHPAARGEAKLMAVAKNGALPSDFPLPAAGEGRAFGVALDLIRVLRPGDVLALNDTRVLRARLRGQLESGGACEVLLLKPKADAAGHPVWECLAKPGRKLTPGKKIVFGPGFGAEITGVLPQGERVLRFDVDPDAFFPALERWGETPLPPYIERPVDVSDAERYQSVFARHPGSVAAPTASLHFSEAMLAEAESKGVAIATLTLHVGAGTFRPVQTARAEDHPMHSEAYSLPDRAAETLNQTRRSGGRIFAVGTTAARVLETCCDDSGIFRPHSGETGLFIRPGYRFKAVDALLTNFHWPRSTLFMLVCSLLGLEQAREAYAEAMRRDFRLFSYGDAMLIV